MLIDLLTMFIQRSFMILELMKDIFLFNFLATAFLENSLQFSIFSLINILNYDDSLMKTPSEIASFAISICFLASFIAIAIYITVSVFRGTAGYNHAKANSKLSSLYELLKNESKSALMFNAVFIVRRMVLAVLLVTQKNSKSIQIFGMIIATLVTIAYLIKVKPFESSLVNGLEIFNEVIIIICLYHMLFFTEALTSDSAMIYQIGWSLDILLFFQFVANLLCIVSVSIYKLTNIIRRFRYRYNLRQKQIKQDKMTLKIQRELAEYNAQLAKFTMATTGGLTEGQFLRQTMDDHGRVMLQSDLRFNSIMQQRGTQPFENPLGVIDKKTGLYQDPHNDYDDHLPVTLEDNSQVNMKPKSQLQKILEQHRSHNIIDYEEYTRQQYIKAKAKSTRIQAVHPPIIDDL